MRSCAWLAALVVAGALAHTANAQRGFGYGTNNNQPLQFVPVNTSNVGAPIAQPQKLGFMQSKIPNFFHTPTQISNKRLMGYSNFPSQQQMPGKDYLSNFKYRGN